MQNLIDSMRQRADQLSFEMDKRNWIGQVQRQIATDLNQLGAKAVELHRQDQLPIPALSALCQTVLRRETQIAELETRIAAIQQEVMPPLAVPAPVDTARPSPGKAVACPTCRTPVMVGARFCPNCGQPVMATPVFQAGLACPNCGVPTVAEAAFCGECGYGLSPRPTPAPLSMGAASIEPAVSIESSGPAVSCQPSVQPPIPDAISLAPPKAAPPPPNLSAPPTSGAALPICATCGAQQRRTDAHFCFVCGNNLIASPGAPPALQAGDAPPTMETAQ